MRQYNRVVTLGAFRSRGYCASKLADHGMSKLELVSNSDVLGANVYDISTRPVEDVTDRAEVNAALYLCEELSNMKASVLLNFVKTKRKARSSPMEEVQVRAGTKESTKNVLELLNHAEQESEGDYGFANIQKKFGSVEDETKNAMRSREWTERGLEAVHLEYSCKKAVLADLRPQSAEQTLKRHGRLVRILTQKLSKVVYEEFETVSLAAVGGVHRDHREEALEALKTVPMKEMMSVFTSFLARALMEVKSVAFLSANTNVLDCLVTEGLVKSPRAEDSLVSLQRMMDLMEGVEVEVGARTQTLDLVGPDHASFMVPAVKRFRDRALRLDATKDAPDFIIDLAVKFTSWEQLARNDITALASASELVFDIILLGVAGVRLMKTLAKDANMEEHQHASKSYCLMLEHVLDAEFKENAQGVIENLNTYANVHSDQTRIDRRLFESIDVNHLSAVGLDSGEPPNERVALILREVVMITSKAPKTFGLYPLLVQLATDMCFHLRFRAVSKRMTVKQRQDTLGGNTHSGVTNTKIWMMLHHYEKEFGSIPISIKAVSFMVTIFLHLLSTGKIMGVNQQHAVQDVPLAMYHPVNGHDEFSIVTVLIHSNPLDMKVAHPPQLKYHSWTDSKDDQGVYSMIPSRPVLGSMSNTFMKSKPPMLQALDIISKVPWRISKYILHVQELILMEGFGFHKIMPSFHPLIHQAMSTGFVPSSSIQSSLNGKKDTPYLYNSPTQKLFRDQRDADHKVLREVSANRQHYLMALRTARTLVNKTEVFFPHKLDFRGRMYPIVGRLNHTGSDPFRAMLDFAHPVPLGENGLYWLKVHLANVMGHNKLTFDERVAFIDQHTDDIMMSAESPLAGERWWHEGDEPVQALRACYELANALKYSQDIRTFPSCLPVHIDGSCNGLQHYSAIGRDADGGKLVNLVPSERPQDVYNGVLKQIIMLVKRDAANDNFIAQRCLGTGKHQDKDHLRRKTIKRAVMTQVYGVTYFGMKEMILSELFSQNNSHQLWTKMSMTEMAGYIRDKLVESLGVTFKRAQMGRAWLDNVTQLIWSTQPQGLKQCFQWVTPLGLIVRQPYTKGSLSTVFTQSGPVKIDSGAVAYASRSQLSALPPNLIHSLDAAHLAMTALEMDRLGIPMVAVHDSFWSHAAHLPTLSKVLRQEFSALYANYDPLWELKEQWEEQFFLDLRRHGIRLPDPPARGDLNIHDVLDSQYFFA